METDQMYSYHIFLFPFRWKNSTCIKEKETVELKECFSLKKFEEALIIDNGKWEISKFKLDNPSNYNEYNYFYDFVREILYDLDEDLQTSSSEQNIELVKHFEYKPADISSNQNEPLYYHIKLKNGEYYALEIDSILLNIYATGTGVLSFHLRNRNYNKPDDILKINQYGRRIYPSFLGLDDSAIITGQKDKVKQLDDSKNELAEAIWISKDRIDSNSEKYNFPNFFDNEDYYKHWEGYYKHGPFQLPQFIKDLFPENFFFTHEKDKRSENKSQIYLRPALDDRMFVVSWYGNNQLVDYLKREIDDYESVHYKYEKNDWWYKYIFTDIESPTVQNQMMKQELLKKHTYSRWTDYGTFYGMTRNSLVLLTSDFDSLIKDKAAFLVRHLQTLYYKMVELVLLQRATILSFSDEVTHLSDLVHQDEEDKEDKKNNGDEENKEDKKDVMMTVSERINDLHKHYILFVNKIYFREITAQEQGIEMYDLLQNVMRIERDVKDLDSEIQELNQFSTMELDREEQSEMKKHTILATIFLPAVLVASFLGMNTMPDKWEITWLPFWPFWISLILIAVIIYFSFKYRDKLINSLDSLDQRKKVNKQSK